MKREDSRVYITGPIAQLVEHSYVERRSRVQLLIGAQCFSQFSYIDTNSVVRKQTYKLHSICIMRENCVNIGRTGGCIPLA